MGSGPIKIHRWFAAFHVTTISQETADETEVFHRLLFLFMLAVHAFLRWSPPFCLLLTANKKRTKTLSCRV
jgi:hypothetical protein